MTSEDEKMLEEALRALYRISVAVNVIYPGTPIEDLADLIITRIWELKGEGQ